MTVNVQELEKELKRDARTATMKAAIHKRLSEQSKQKAGNLMQQVQNLRNKLEEKRYKAYNEVGNLNSILNFDSAKKETPQN